MVNDLYQFRGFCDMNELYVLFDVVFVSLSCESFFKFQRFATKNATVNKNVLESVPALVDLAELGGSPGEPCGQGLQCFRSSRGAAFLSGLRGPCLAPYLVHRFTHFIVPCIQCCHLL